jgi:ABC-type multidrug transport system fused ATPase/permease subunit
VPDAAVVDALRAVGLDGLADGDIHRQLGAAGTGLSAGEAQLLSLARVWMRDPDLLVLDEATARIDPETERQIEAAVARLMVGRTTLIIAHRLSTLHAVDDIVVFDRGEVTEFGARVDLVGDDESQFARLVSLSLDARDDDSAIAERAVVTS